MTTADVLLADQGRRTCEVCTGSNHRPSEMLWFRAYAMKWLCEVCDTQPRVYGTGFSGGCKDDTLDPNLPYIGDQPVKIPGATEGNEKE